MSLVKSQVLAHVWDHPGIHRKQIAELAGVHPALVSAAARALIKEQWIVEGESKKTLAGRSPVSLQMYSGCRAAVAVTYTPDSLTCGLVNVNGDIVCSNRVRHKLRNPEALVDLTLRQIDKIRRQTGKTNSRIVIGMAVADPGMVDHLRGVVIRSSSFLDWHNVALAEIFHTKTGFATMLLDVTHARAMAQYRLLPVCREKPKNVLYIDYYSGTIGFAFLTPRGIWRGGGLAGEVGHVSTDPRGAICHCGARGCLESRAGAGALVDHARNLLAQKGSSVLRSLKCPVEADVFEAARKEDRLARTIVRDTLEELGLCTAVITAMLHPDLIVVGAETDAAAHVLRDELQRALNERVVAEIVSTVKVVKGLSSDILSLTGAGLMLFERTIRAGKLT